MPRSSAKRAPVAAGGRRRRASTSAAIRLRRAGAGVRWARAHRTAAAPTRSPATSTPATPVTAWTTASERSPGWGSASRVAPSGKTGLTSGATTTPTIVPANTAGMIDAAAAMARSRRPTPSAISAAASLGRRCKWRAAAWAMRAVPTSAGHRGGERQRVGLHLGRPDGGLQLIEAVADVALATDHGRELAGDCRRVDTVGEANRENDARPRTLAPATLGERRSGERDQVRRRVALQIDTEADDPDDRRVPDRDLLADRRSRAWPASAPGHRPRARASRHLAR